MAIFAVYDRKDPRASGHTCPAPSTAKPSSVTSKSDRQVVSTYLKRDVGNTKNSFCNWVQLTGVNILLVLCEYWTTDLGEDRGIFNCPVDRFLY